MAEPSILELILGHAEEGQTIYLPDLEMSDILSRLDTVELTSRCTDYLIGPSRWSNMFDDSRRPPRNHISFNGKTALPT